MSTVNMGALVYDVGMEEDPATKEGGSGNADGAEYNRGISFRKPICHLVFTIVISVTPGSTARPRAGNRQRRRASCGARAAGIGQVAAAAAPSRASARARPSASGRRR